MNQTDDVLMERWQKGDEQAFHDLFDRYLPLVVRYIMTLCGNWEEAKDLAQETFMRVCERKESFQSRSRFKSWLLTIARNKVIDATRKRSVKTVVSEELLARAPAPEDGFPCETTLDTEQMPGFKALTAGQREIVLLRFVEDLSFGEIAAVTSMREDNIRKILSRALQRLRKEWQSHDVRTAE